MTLRFGIISHLKACKNIKVTFNPWLPQTRSIRYVTYFIYIYMVSCKYSVNQLPAELKAAGELNDKTKNLAFMVMVLVHLD